MEAEIHETEEKMKLLGKKLQDEMHRIDLRFQKYTKTAAFEQYTNELVETTKNGL